MSSKVSVNLPILRIKWIRLFFFSSTFLFFVPSHCYFLSNGLIVVTFSSYGLCCYRAELQASDSRYQTQRRITQLLQTELLQLYSRVEMETPASTAAGSPPGGRADPHIHADSRSDLEDSSKCSRLPFLYHLVLGFPNAVHVVLLVAAQQLNKCY